MPRPRVQPNRLKALTLPAPSGGLNTTSDGTATPPSDCLLLWNMTAAEYGLRTRLGYREWVTGLDGQVRSLLPYTGTRKDGSAARLFATTQTGIYEVTSTGTRTLANRVVVFGTQDINSGWGNSTAFTTIAGGFLCYCDEANGYYVYQESDSSWHKIAAGGGAWQVQEAQGAALPACDPTKFVFVKAYRNMLWFVEGNSGRAWYLPVGQVTGTGAYPFTFGNKFQNGGDLRCLYGWTMGAGSDMDDALVAISSGGDCVAYRGTDPSQASGFFEVGYWFLGALPAGRRICTETGGDLLVLTTLGLLPLSRLSGNTLIGSSQYETFKVGNLFNLLGSTSRTVRGWGARLHPVDNSLIVLIPQAAGLPTQQLVMSTLNKSWSRYRGMPMGVAAEAFLGSFYFGTEDGRICIMDGYLDGVARDGTGGTAIEFSMLSTFQDLGRPTLKRVQIVRPMFMTQGAPPVYKAAARYDWDQTETGVPAQVPNAKGAIWDAGAWDQGQWSSGDYQSTQLAYGGQGVGRQVAVTIRGTASARMTLVNIDVVFDEGGLI